MIPSTLKTIFVDGDLDDSSLLLDVQHPYRDKDLLLANQFDDVDDIVHDQVRQPAKMNNSPMSGFYSLHPFLRFARLSLSLLFSLSLSLSPCALRYC